MTIGTAAVLTIVSCMEGGNSGCGGNNVRAFRTWGPEQQQRVPFRRWVREVTSQTAAISDVEERRQTAFASPRLTSVAWDCVGEWPPQMPMPGGMSNGVAVGPMTFLACSLAEKWTALGEEE